MPSNIFRWYGRFFGGWEGIQDNPSIGHPSWVLNRRQHQKGSAAVVSKLSPVTSNDSGWAWHQQGYCMEDCRWISGRGRKLCACYVLHALTAEQEDWVAAGFLQRKALPFFTTTLTRQIWHLQTDFSSLKWNQNLKDAVLTPVQTSRTVWQVN